ncbi:MAG: electron transfer flavoprotein subunit alpha/FixB family protein [Chloroflexia bacterium]|nr:electron transfer flavoprotein subunit alpha/FixB family protein [Chloroflexia bacterium]
MTQAFWVFAEQRRGALQPVSLEILGRARELADQHGLSLEALLLGHNAAPLADDLLAYGADTVYYADDPLLQTYSLDAYAAVIERLAREHQPDVLVLGHTSLGRDLAPMVAARLDTGLSAHVTGLEFDEAGLLRQIVPAFGGRGMCAILCPQHRPQMATVRPGVLQRPERRPGHRGQIVQVEPEIDPAALRTRLLEVVPQETDVAPLTEAEIVVAGGAGMGDREGWKLIEELAEVLGAAVGGTRPPLDEGWIAEGQMIGQSGVTVRPLLYIGAGISGELQHTVGIRDAGVVVAINVNPKAAIFQEADFGIVGDAREVLPALIQALRERQECEVESLP